MSRATSATFFALVALVSAAPALATERVVVETEHYRLTSAGELAEAEEWGRVLEAAWPQYAEFFGDEPELEPDERLVVAVFEDDASFRAAIVAGGGTPPSAGGYYCPTARTAYFKRQPTVWFTRNLLLHEAAHQFHYLACTGNDAPSGDWYVEGVAEHLGSHAWDGETLSVGVEPVLSLEDRAGAAQAAVARDDFSLESLLTAEPVSRPEAMYLLRFLVVEQGKRLLRYRKKVDRGAEPSLKDFRKSFGKSDELVADWRAWLETRQSPLVPVFVEWDTRRNDRVRGTGDAITLCRTRGTVRAIETRLQPVDERRLRAGLVLAFEAPRRYTLAMLERRATGGVLELDRMDEGKWTSLGVHELPELAETPLIRAEHTDGGLVVSVDGRKVATLPPADDPEPLGLALEGCTIDFDDLVVER